MVASQAVKAHSFGLPEHQKRQIYRITTPEGKVGTGFVVSDSAAGYMLVTNKHLVWSDTAMRYLDSVFLHVNVINERGKVKSLDSTLTLRLRKDTTLIVQEHPDTNVDLVVMPLQEFAIRSGLEKLIGFSTRMIPHTAITEINDGALLQVVGYSWILPQANQFPTSRFGRVASCPQEKVSIILKSGENRTKEVTSE
jgi:hypothetical protein